MQRQCVGRARNDKLGTTAAVALALHALCFAGAARIEAPPTVPQLRRGLSSFASHEVELELEPSAPSKAPPLESPALAMRVLPRARFTPKHHPRASGNEHTAESAAETRGATNLPAVPTARSDSEPKRTPPSLDAIGLGTTNPLLGRDSPTPQPARQAELRLERSLQDGLAEHDRVAGLGGGGPVLSALEQAAYASALPRNTSALLVAQIDASGHLSLLDVSEVSSDFQNWAKLARRVLGTLGRKKFRLPHGSHGKRLSIRVSSREVLPSGTDPGLEVRLLGARLQKGRGKRSATISILEPVAKVQWIEVPTPSGDTIRLPVFVAGINLFAAAGDASDIGAHPRRVVHAQVESEETL